MRRRLLRGVREARPRLSARGENDVAVSAASIGAARSGDVLREEVAGIEDGSIQASGAVAGEAVTELASELAEFY